MTFSVGDPEVFWLNVTNIALGLVVLACLAAVAVAVAREWMVRARKRASAMSEIDADMHVLAHDDHAFHMPRLGMTMADGGERVDGPGKKEGK